MENERIFFHSHGTPRARRPVRILGAVIMAIIAGLTLFWLPYMEEAPSNALKTRWLFALPPLLMIPLFWVLDWYMFGCSSLTLYKDHVKGTQARPIGMVHASQNSFRFAYREIADVQFNKSRNLLIISCHGQDYVVAVNDTAEAYALLCEKIYGRK